MNTMLFLQYLSIAADSFFVIGCLYIAYKEKQVKPQVTLLILAGIFLMNIVSIVWGMK